jgi:hypothetical protein
MGRARPQPPRRFNPLEKGVAKPRPLRFDRAAFRRQFLQEEGISQRGHLSGLLVVGGSAVASFDVFVIQHVVPLFFYARDHLPGVWTLGWIMKSHSGQSPRRTHR